MKMRDKLCLLFSFLLLLAQLSVMTQATAITAPTAPVTGVVNNSCYGVDADSALLGTESLTKNVKAAVVYEAKSQTLMYTYNADEPMSPASLVKIMTALIAVEKGALDEIVTATESALKEVPFDAVSADIVADEKMTLEALLYCMLTGSANDAAVVIAEHISGSHGAFVQEMNDYAASLGCKSTVFTNAHGLHDDAQYTTARDSARILAAAIANESFRSVFAATAYTVEATNKSEARELTTGNAMLDKASRLYYDSRVIGGRTGVTKDGRRCLATVAESNGMQLVTVVMGSESVYEEDGYTAISVGGYNETSQLLDAGFTGYKTVQVLCENQSLMQYSVVNGNCDVVVGPNVSISTVLPEAVTSAELTYRYSTETLEAPIEKGQKLSTVQVWHGGLCVAQADLYALNAVRLTQIEEDNEHESAFQWPVALTVVLCVLGSAFLVIISLRIIRVIRIWIRKTRIKRYRRSRRRSR